MTPRATADGPLRDGVESGQVHRNLCSEVRFGVFGEGFGNEYPSVVDPRIDTAKLLDRAANHPVRDRRVGDVAGVRQYVR